ncbi:MAG TPA: phage holin family protein [Flavihumibacter sp.]|nr:phage holin family protein [Bacteroidota bacterium]HOA36857.1 phage holin family protein [Flavihumibacter sp.]HQD10990.1 phage holin family protein [Flavihumibacter sp.]
MEAIKNSVEALLDHSSELAETYYKLSVAKVTEKASKTAATGSFALVAVAVGVIVLFMLGLGFAWWIGEHLQNMKAGFFIMAAVYAVLLLLLIVFRRKLFMLPIGNAVIRSVYDNEYDNENK